MRRRRCDVSVKNMKKRCVSFTLAMLLFAGMLASCAGNTSGGDGTTTTDIPGTSAPAPDTTTDGLSAEDTTTSAHASSETTVPSSSDTTADQPTPATPPRSLKILAIGNSFSTDCMQYLYGMLKSGGVEEIVLGNLYYGGCSLAQHLDFARNNKNVYKYYKNTSGSWTMKENYVLSDAVADEKWDYISFQQTSKTCGLVNSYGKTLTTLVDFVEKLAPEARLIWNMTWAYQQDSTHSSFPNYGKSQQKMYDMIIDCVEKCIKPEGRFVLIIPCMTSIQNARTSFLGDTLTRDGYHLDYNIGRYIAGLTWFSALTGLSPDAVSYNPSPTVISDDMLAVAREAVAAAIAEPEKVTQSKITEGKRGDSKVEDDPSEVLDPADFFEADKTAAAASGIDLSKFKLLEWDYLENCYWYCTKNTTTTTPKAGSSTYRQNVCTKTRFTTDTIPAGSVFVCDAGWQYRLEIYPSENAQYSGTRPGMRTDRVFVITDEFLDGCKMIAWNVSSSPKRDISAIYAQAACHVRVYVPIS